MVSENGERGRNPIKEDVKKKLLPALHGQMHVVACIQPRWNAGGVFVLLAEQPSL